MAVAFSEGAQLRCRLARESGDSSEDVEASASCYARLVSWDSGDGLESAGREAAAAACCGGGRRGGIVAECNVS